MHKKIKPYKGDELFLLLSCTALKRLNEQKKLKLMGKIFSPPVHETPRNSRKWVQFGATTFASSACLTWESSDGYVF